MCQSHTFGRIRKNTAQGALTDININQNNLFVRLGDTHGKITRYECLTRTRISGSKHDHLQLFRLHTHKVHVRTDNTESLGDRITTVLTDNNTIRILTLIIAMAGNIA